MTIEVADAGMKPHTAVAELTLGWAVRRALLGITILVLSVSALAWLLYTTIDPDEAHAGSDLAASQVTISQPR